MVSPYGQGVSPRKVMAGALDKGSFGVGSPFDPHTTQRDGVGELADGQRGVGNPVSRPGNHPGQAAPDHGDMGTDHFTRGGKA